MMNLDLTKVKPAPIQETLFLINNFVINSVKFLNNFSECCEEKISKVSRKLNDLEIVLAILETKLNSVPGLEYSSSDLPTTEAQTASSSAPSAPSTSTQPTTSAASASNAPVPPAPSAAVVASTSTELEVHVPTSTAVSASDHPDYAMFFKLLRLGVPAPVVKAKVAAAGLNPDAIDNPSMVITGEGASSSAAPSAPPALSRRIFDKFDVDRSGSIDGKELQRMCLEFGVWLEGNALQMALRAMDHDGNGSISYDEFLKWYKSSSFSDLKLDDVTLQRRNAASKVFTKFDTDGSGSLERNEFAGLFKEIRLLNLTSLSLEDCLEDMDMDGDGTIQFNEFVVWLDRH